VVGAGYSDYRTHLLKHGVDLSKVVTTGAKTAMANIITDPKDNQITAFYPGPSVKNYARQALASLRHIDLAIIAPDDKSRMLEYVSVYRNRKIPFIFDPGQQLTVFSGAELKNILSAAEIVIGNDYEIKMILNKLGVSFGALRKLVKTLAVTKGGEGSDIYSGTDKVSVKPAKPKNTSDPTGAGDAYRAGLIKGLLNGYNLKTCGQLAGLVACYTVEKAGTQTHRFTAKELQARYYTNFKEKITL